MHTIKLQLQDEIYQDIVNSGIDIQEEFKKTINRLLHKKEHIMAQEINSAINDVKANKSKPINELLNAL